MANATWGSATTKWGDALFGWDGRSLAAAPAAPAPTVGGGAKWRKRKLQLGVTVRAEVWPVHNRAFRDDDDLLSLL